MWKTGACDAGRHDSCVWPWCRCLCHEGDVQPLTDERSAGLPEKSVPENGGGYEQGPTTANLCFVCFGCGNDPCWVDDMLIPEPCRACDGTGRSA